MIRFWAGALGVAGAVAAGAVLAQDNPVVVELFTSQGCSSCPPADAILHDLARMDGVIALALHVDYWDYIGWPDSFAKAEFTARQESYARAWHETSVYTPQAIVGGVDALVGSDAMALMERVAAHGRVDLGVKLDAARSGGTVRIAAETAAAFAVPVHVDIVHYLPESTVTISGGENAGHTLTYVNIVTDWTRAGTWDGAAPLAIEVPDAQGGPAVVILQEDGPGRIMAAAHLD